MNTLAVPLIRQIRPTPANTAKAVPPPAGRWLSVLVVAVLLAAFSLTARSGR